MSGFFFSRDELLPQAASLATAYASADPFPHIVIDDFLPKAALDELVAAFPEPDDHWTGTTASNETKYSLADEEWVPAPLRTAFHQFNSAVFIDYLEQLTGIEGLLPDPHLWGGGLHQIGAGGLLKVHADFNVHPRLGLDRRLNVLLYLNPVWEDEWAGHLELWDRDMTTCGARIAPIANRMVVFSTTRHSYHGHPDPLTQPPGVWRRSMAFYYYTSPRVPRSWHTTMFRARPGEQMTETPEAPRTKRDLALRLTPPVVYDAIRDARDRRRRRTR